MHSRPRVPFTILLLLLTAGMTSSAPAADAPKSADNPFGVHKNHVRKTSGDYLANFRRITWHYDYATAADLARETGRPLFVIFCRAGAIGDPRTGKPKCAS